MDCDIAREALSARLDGEEPGVDSGDVDRHLAGCAGCEAWYQRVAALDRLARIAPAEEPRPDLGAVILAQVALPRRGRWRRLMIVALMLVALAQLAIGLASLFVPLGMPAGMDMSVHMDHETAAFNLAFGVILLLVGRNTRRAATQVPVLASFVAVLAVASVIDLADGNVDLARLVTHLPVVLGLVLTVALSRQPHIDSGPGGWSRTAVRFGAGRVRGGVPRDLPAGSGPADGHQDQTPAAHRHVA